MKLFVKAAKAYRVAIYMAGDRVTALQVCREYCLAVGLCVTVSERQYVYAGGEEAGFMVELVNYPRFPSDPRAIFKNAEQLARALISALHQHSAMIQDDKQVVWMTRRQENMGK